MRERAGWVQYHTPRRKSKMTMKSAICSLPVLIRYRSEKQGIRCKGRGGGGVSGFVRAWGLAFDFGHLVRPSSPFRPSNRPRRPHVLKQAARSILPVLTPRPHVLVLVERTPSPGTAVLLAVAFTLALDPRPDSSVVVVCVSPSVGLPSLTLGRSQVQEGARGVLEAALARLHKGTSGGTRPQGVVGRGRRG